MTARLVRDGSIGRIQILHVPDCPLVDEVVQLVRECPARLGDTGALDLRVGPYPSPTLLVDGIDVTTGAAVAGAARCRLDLPTTEQILDALAPGQLTRQDSTCVHLGNGFKSWDAA